MQHKKIIVAIAAACTGAAALFAIWLVWQPTTHSPSASEPTPPALHIAQMYRAGSDTPDQFSEVLSVSIPAAQAVLGSDRTAELRREAQVWLLAYASHDSGNLTRALIESGVELPQMWNELAEQAFDQSVASFRKVHFDPGQTMVTTVTESNPLRITGFQSNRCGSRDAARPMLADDRIRAMPRRAVLFQGVFTADDGQPHNVMFVMEFLWHADRSRWLLVRNCWYGLPNEEPTSVPIL